MNLMPVPGAWLRAHWFLPLAVVIALADTLLARTDDWHAPRVLEATLLFDFVILIPLLALWCYRAQGKQAVLRALGLACLALWATGIIVPQQHHNMLSALSWLRPLGLVVLTLYEIRVLIMLYRAVFGSKDGADEVAAKITGELGMPPFVARLLAWEARLWRKIAGFLNRFTGR